MEDGILETQLVQVKPATKNLIRKFYIPSRSRCPKDFTASIPALLSDENVIVLDDGNADSSLRYSNIPKDQRGSRLEAEIIESTFLNLTPVIKLKEQLREKLLNLAF